MPTPDSTVPALAITDLRKEYPNGVVAVDEVSFTVNRGEVVVIVGPSGCGKSTLLRCLNGLETATGHIDLDGVPVPSKNLPWHVARQRVGMVFQSYELFPHLTVMDNLLLAPTTVLGADREASARKAARLLKRVGLLDRANAWPRQLSGGQKQRVAIVRALMMDPEVLLLDEVTASLDPELVREVLNVVLELAREGMTMVIVTHEMAFARAIADTVLFMDRGRVVERGGREFFDRPKTERARQFLNIFTFEEEVEERQELEELDMGASGWQI